MRRHILILGGDGFLGWPTALYFSARGWNVSLVDNYLRRTSCEQLGVEMMFKTPLLLERTTKWYESTGNEIRYLEADLTDPKVMSTVVSGDFTSRLGSDGEHWGTPCVVVHYAEQPSAPYSMMNLQTANQTLQNNITVTNNLMFAVKTIDPHIHIIKLGTMGEYGTPNIDIEEGWIDINHKGRQQRFLFPRQASSIYHTSKIMDTDLLWFGVRTWGLKVTDLMQGPVYGLQTDETSIHQDLWTYFNYDEIFGTVLNRFIVQALIGTPLTVYGSGDQTRGYINIVDTMQCIYRAAHNPIERGDLKIFNQMTETFSVNKLANMVKGAMENIGVTVSIHNVQNPRVESEQHYYNPKFQGILDMGIVPHTLNYSVIQGIYAMLEPFKDHVDREMIFKGVKW